MRVVLLGPPGAGKGTQSVLICQRYGIARIATGELLRRHASEGTDLGRSAKLYMDRGDLVPDGIVIALVHDLVVSPAAERGFLLDGYPRTLEQAEAAYEWARERDMTFHAALSFELPEEELFQRLRGRVEQEHRADDSEEIVRHRLEVFAAKTQPLVDYYERRGILERIDALGTVDEVTNRIVAALEARRPTS